MGYFLEYNKHLIGPVIDKAGTALGPVYQGDQDPHFSKHHRLCYV